MNFFTIAGLAAIAAAGADLPEAALTLDQALDEAGRNNVDLALARAGRDDADAAVNGSYAAVLPRLDLNAGFANIWIGQQKGQFAFDQNPIPVPQFSYRDYTLGMSLKQPIFDGMRSWTEIRRAKQNLQAGDRQIDETSLAMAFEVTRRFYEVVRAERSLSVLEEVAGHSERNLKREEDLYAAGRATKSDVYAARVNLGTDRVNIEAQRATLTQARANLEQGLGRQVGAGVMVVAPATLDGPPPAPDQEIEPLGQLNELAAANRPAIKRQMALINSAELGITSAEADWYPTIGINAGYNREGPALGGNHYSVYGSLDKQFNASAGLYAQWNLFNGGLSLANRQHAVVGARQAKLNAEQTTLQVQAEVARARTNVVVLARECNLTKQNLDTAEEGVRLANDRLEVGAVTQIEVRDALLKLEQAKLSYLSARIDYVLARADLNRAVGGALTWRTP